ncbi:MAG: hypothetical protein ACPGN3_12730 [Opitutales bacterium]
MKTILSTLTFVAFAIFATMNLQAEIDSPQAKNGPINTPGLVTKNGDGDITFRADTGTTYYAWAEQPKEELTPFVGKRITLRANTKVTARGLDFIAWVVKVSEQKSS